MSDFLVHRSDGSIFTPPQHHGRGKVSRFPFRYMEVGDSFYVPPGDPGLEIGNGANRMTKVAKAAKHFRSYSGRRFTVVRTRSGGRKVWRVA